MTQEAIWDYFQNQDPGSFRDAAARLAFLVRLNRAGQRVLNIGIGGGTFEELAIHRRLDVHTLDPNQKSIEALRARLALGQRAQVGFCQEIPFDDSFFDAVVMSEVLEHLDDGVLEQALREVYRVLKPAGRFLITVPAREELAQNIVVCPSCGHAHHRWGHLQSFTPERIRAVLAPRFEIERLDQRLFIVWRSLNWKGKILAALKWTLNRLGVHGSSETLLAVARKRD